MKPFLAAVVLAVSVFAAPLAANEIGARDGWTVMPTGKSYGALVKSVIAATKANKMGVVTQAGPTKAAAARGITIPGNRVIGVFNNHFAVEILNLSTAAMIEAPIRIYVTENDDGTATVSYKHPSTVFAPYMDEGGSALADLAGQLDQKFAAIVKAAAAD